MARQAEVVGGRGGRMLPFVEQNPFGILFRPLHDGVGVTFIRTVMSSSSAVGGETLRFSNSIESVRKLAPRRADQ